MTTATLAILATEDDWQGFDEAWTQLITSNGPVDDLVGAIEVVAEKRRLARCLPRLREHAGLLEEKARHEEAARLLGAAVRGGGPVNELGLPLFAHAERAWGAEAWWRPMAELAGFRPEAGDLRAAWLRFDEMRSYEAGVVVFHAAGWGTGEVLEVRRVELEVEVRFQSGRRDRFPLRTAAEIFERLPATDLRAQALRDPVGLRKRLKDEPIEILRAVLLRYNGRATNIVIKNTLEQIGVTGSAWSAWWRKARVLAENSAWFRVKGNASRSQIELLQRAVDPVEGIRIQLRHAPNLGEALTRVRDLLTGNKLEPNVHAAVLDVIEQQAADPDQELEHRLAAWLLLREHCGETPAELLLLLKEARTAAPPADPAMAPALWAMLQQIPGAREQERCGELLQEVFGEAWLDEAAANLAHSPPGAVKQLVDELLRAGKQDLLAETYRTLLARPTRAPFALITLAKLAENGALQGEFPGPTQRAQALIELGVRLEAERRGDPLKARALQRLVELLTKGEEPLLRRLLAQADTASLRSIRSMLARGVDDRIDALVTDIALEQGPELFTSDAVPFWKEDSIWTTRAGLAARDADLRELTEKKIPENSAAIARAASYGDISENAEWENAIAEQRQLTTQAAAIEQELRKAALLENAPLLENTVCPGTEVTYREIASGEQHTIRILGPWDTHAEGVVSYMAPLAAGMLGKHVGERAIIVLPGGQLEVEVQAIGPAALA
jgi:transcription elongation GreA/GreB family factor